VTICLASTTVNGPFVTVSDKRITWGEGGTPADDEGTLKNAMIAKHWGMMFSTDNMHPVAKLYEDVRRRLEPQKNTLNQTIVRSAVEAAYRAAFEERFVGERLSRYGFRSMEQFRNEGMDVFGPALMEKFSKEIDNYYLGSTISLSLLIYGFDSPPPLGWQHIFIVENPGVAQDCDMFGYAIIGSGHAPALAALLSKRFTKPTLTEAIWRLCEAKFSAEAAYAVGKETHVILLKEDGGVVMMLPGPIKKLRELYEKERRAPIPPEASEAIKSGLKGLIPNIESEGI